jgi:hypothetical protein
LAQLGLRKRSQKEIVSLETLYDAVAIPLSCTEFLSDEEYRKVKGSSRVCGWKSKKGNSEDSSSSAYVDSAEAKKMRKEIASQKPKLSDKSEVVVIGGTEMIPDEKKRKRPEEVSEFRKRKLLKLKEAQRNQEEHEKKVISAMPSFLKKVYFSFVDILSHTFDLISFV